MSPFSMSSFLFLIISLTFPVKQSPFFSKEYKYLLFRKALFEKITL